MSEQNRPADEEESAAENFFPRLKALDVEDRENLIDELIAETVDVVLVETPVVAAVEESGARFDDVYSFDAEVTFASPEEIRVELTFRCEGEDDDFPDATAVVEGRALAIIRADDLDEDGRQYVDYYVIEASHTWEDADDDEDSDATAVHTEAREVGVNYADAYFGQDVD